MDQFRCRNCNTWESAGNSRDYDSYDHSHSKRIYYRDTAYNSRDHTHVYFGHQHSGRYNYDLSHQLARRHYFPTDFQSDKSTDSGTLDKDSDGDQDTEVVSLATGLHCLPYALDLDVCLTRS